MSSLMLVEESLVGNDNSGTLLAVANADTSGVLLDNDKVQGLINLGTNRFSTYPLVLGTDTGNTINASLTAYGNAQSWAYTQLGFPGLGNGAWVVNMHDNSGTYGTLYGEQNNVGYLGFLNTGSSTHNNLAANSGVFSVIIGDDGYLATSTGAQFALSSGGSFGASARNTLDNGAGAMNIAGLLTANGGLAVPSGYAATFNGSLVANGASTFGGSVNMTGEFQPSGVYSNLGNLSQGNTIYNGQIANSYTPVDLYPIGDSVFGTVGSGNSGFGDGYGGNGYGTVRTSRGYGDSTGFPYQLVIEDNGPHIQIRRVLSYSKPTWAASTAYAVGDYVMPTQANMNGWYFECTTAGTSGTTEPTWPDALNATVDDGTVVWTASGQFWTTWADITRTDVGYTWQQGQTFNGPVTAGDGVLITGLGGANNASIDLTALTTSSPYFDALANMIFTSSAGSSATWNIVGSTGATIFTVGVGSGNLGQLTVAGSGSFGGNVIASGAFHISALEAQPSTSSAWGVFGNSNTTTMDFVSNGWRFIPPNGTTYPSPVVTITGSGAVGVAGLLTASGGISIPSGYAATINGSLVANAAATFGGTSTFNGNVAIPNSAPPTSVHGQIVRTTAGTGSFTFPEGIKTATATISGAGGGGGGGGAGGNGAGTTLPGGGGGGAGGQGSVVRIVLQLTPGTGNSGTAYYVIGAGGAGGAGGTAGASGAYGGGGGNTTLKHIVRTWTAQGAGAYGNGGGGGKGGGTTYAVPGGPGGPGGSSALQSFATTPANGVGGQKGGTNAGTSGNSSGGNGGNMQGTSFTIFGGLGGTSGSINGAAGNPGSTISVVDQYEGAPGGAGGGGGFGNRVSGVYGNGGNGGSGSDGYIVIAW